MELLGLPTAIPSQKGRTGLAWLYFTITSTPHREGSASQSGLFSLALAQ